MLLSSTEGYAEDKDDRWVPYGKTESGEYFYYKTNRPIVTTKTLRVWEKIKYSKLEKERVIKVITNSDKPKEGYNKLDFSSFLCEISCIDKTTKVIKSVQYNDEGKIIEVFDFTSPQTHQILPNTIDELLLNAICQKK